MSSCFFFTIFYILISGCIVYPPTEFVSAGLIIEDLFSGWLGSENEYFIQYHIKRTAATIFVHSLIPCGYILGLICFDYMQAVHDVLHSDRVWLEIVILTAAWPIYSLCKSLYWSLGNWSFHPVAKILKTFCDSNQTWVSIATGINIEYKSIDKTIIHMNSIYKVVITNNWIIKVTPYNLNIAHQRDAALIVVKCDTHAMSANTRGEVQYIDIQVKPFRRGTKPFNIRINSLHYKDFCDRISCPIAVLQNVTFHKTLLDRFVDTFKKHVSANPRYDTVEELEQCIGCMQVTSNVKLNTLCENVQDENGSNACSTCHCRPMWCVECMAKWFASKQDESAPETWLSSKCSCPVCRATFCILDVSLINSLN
ncbi:E3 ubiquitin-protein ligase TM129 [Orussus abietinus]|uniref:E3 ubiquitin-protein ligase TM129 n=1 Tax=Orussus abietinus TaxID=222816 RepID=UPI0006252A22|nr:E3 ubiquitin-protein ligase TM129 [Orussus abietinus]